MILVRFEPTSIETARLRPESCLVYFPKGCSIKPDSSSFFMIVWLITYSGLIFATLGSLSVRNSIIEVIPATST